MTDNGRGIPEDELELVFEKFRQASSGGEKPIGTGLGLPISRQIVENFGGRIWAEEAHPQRCYPLFRTATPRTSC